VHYVSSSLETLIISLGTVLDNKKKLQQSHVSYLIGIHVTADMTYGQTDVISSWHVWTPFVYHSQIFCQDLSSVIGVCS